MGGRAEALRLAVGLWRVWTRADGAPAQFLARSLEGSADAARIVVGLWLTPAASPAIETFDANSRKTLNTTTCSPVNPCMPKQASSVAQA